MTERSNRMTFDDSGIPFRSRLEQEIAAELDTHLVSWGYEMPVILPDGQSPRYLPDFTIHEADKELELPRWVEGKPMQFLYDFRDSLGVTRTHGDRFAGEIIVDGIDSERIKSMHIEELWKPKYLAELTSESVLVVGGVGGTSRLSVEMRPNSVAFTRQHPFVNWPGHQRQLKQAADRVRWQQERATYEAERARKERDYADNIEARRVERITSIASHTPRGATRFNTSCAGCSTAVGVGEGTLYRVGIIGGGERWMVLCDRCRGEGEP